MVHDLLQIELKLIKHTPKIVSKKCDFWTYPFNSRVQIRKGD